MLAIFHPPTRSTSVRDIYIGTLSPSLWVALILTWLLVYGGYWILLLCNHSDVQSNECFLIIVAAISEQGRRTHGTLLFIYFFTPTYIFSGWYKRDGRLPFWILTFISFVFGYIILESFRATIISELAFERQLVKVFDDLFTNGFKILTNPLQQWGRYIAPVSQFMDTNLI